MNFLAQDLLDFGQINAYKFRCNLKEFNIVKAVEEVISIQKIKADMLKI